jgi:hypothetical protein
METNHHQNRKTRDETWDVKKCLIPIVSRAIELDRGSPEMISWISTVLQKLDTIPESLINLAEKPHVEKLAFELSKILLTSGLYQTWERKIEFVQTIQDVGPNRLE